MSMGYSSETARVALQQSNNNASLSVQLIQEQPGLLNVACTSKFKVKKEILQQVWFCSEEHKIWHILHAVHRYLDIDTCIKLEIWSS
jgi:hypothetical protein